MKKKFSGIAISSLLALTILLSSCGASSSVPSSAAEYTSSAASSTQTEPETAAEAPAADYQDTAEGEGTYPTRESARAGESYLVIDENQAKLAGDESTLTFSLKVDTAAYTNVARYIESGNLPPRDAVRTEEMINYFTYDTAMSFDNSPFALYTEIGPSPFDAEKYMAFIRVKTEEIDKSELPSSNLTFLIDTSGSMDSHDKLPLLKDAFILLSETLDEDDRVSIVTYAGSSAIVLDSCSGSDKAKILSAINNLSAGGSTAGADGIMTAYALAEKNYVEGGNNRIILATDGDFNVGISDVNELARLVAEKKDSGLYLSILGFGTGNIRDDIMETLSTNGSGNYSYINSVSTAEKILVDELGSNLFTVADDVKAQVEFNADNVKSYRLIGYENRKLNNEDFEDDTKDAGEIGIGTDVVVMFELELEDSAAVSSSNLFEVRIRYKNPGEAESNLITRPVAFGNMPAGNSSDFGFACSVAAFGHLLRDSQHTGSVTIGDALSLAKANLGADAKGYRLEYAVMLEQYRRLIG